MPSHSWPVVAVPVRASISLCCSATVSVLFERNLRRLVELLLARGPKRVGQHQREQRDEIAEPDLLGGFGDGAIGRVHGGHRMLALSSKNKKTTKEPSVWR